MPVVTVKKKMRNMPEKFEYFLALEAFPELPMQTPRTFSRDDLVKVLERWVEIAKNGELVEVEA